MKPLSKEWTAEDRLRVVAAALPMLLEDIQAGKYGRPGHPNITSLQHITHESALVLEGSRKDLEVLVAEHEAKYPELQQGLWES